MREAARWIKAGCVTAGNLEATLIALVQQPWHNACLPDSGVPRAPMSLCGEDGLEWNERMTPYDDGARSHPLRFWIALVVWLLCLPGLYFHVVVFGFTAIGGLVSGAWLNASDLFEIAYLPLFVLSTLSWLVFAKMTVYWIEDRAAHWAWPVIGTALTLPVLIPAHFIAAFFVLPGVLLALFLCFWHLRGWYTGKATGRKEKCA